MEQRTCQVEIITNVDKEKFQNEIYPKRCPVILRGLDIGKAKETWNASYVSSVVKNTVIKVHVSPVAQMNFLTKNFMYKTIPFDELVKRASKTVQEEFFICEDEKYYLRSVGTDARKDVADIRKDFPGLANDITFPDFFDEDNFFSSVFRISSAKAQLWTHYDVMDNFLVQVVGRKRVVLFSPNEALNMYLDGDKSKVVDIDNPDLATFPNFQNVIRHQCIMEPGDVLFIPALWFHNVIALDFSIAVNIFWRHLNENLYDKKDIYGNKDPVPVTRAFQSLDKILKQLSDLPKEYRDFYSRRMILKIQSSGNLLD